MPLLTLCFANIPRSLWAKFYFEIWSVSLKLLGIHVCKNTICHGESKNIHTKKISNSYVCFSFTLKTYLLPYELFDQCEMKTRKNNSNIEMVLMLAEAQNGRNESLWCEINSHEGWKVSIKKVNQNNSNKSSFQQMSSFLLVIFVATIRAVVESRFKMRHPLMVVQNNEAVTLKITSPTFKVGSRRNLEFQNNVLSNTKKRGPQKKPHVQRTRRQ